MFAKIVSLGVIVLVVCTAWVFDGVGYRRAEVKYLAQQAAMEKANKTAIAKAEKALEEDLAQAQIENERLENAYDQLVQGARSDARARDCGVSSDGVRRLNSLR